MNRSIGAIGTGITIAIGAIGTIAIGATLSIGAIGTIAIGATLFIGVTIAAGAITAIGGLLVGTAAGGGNPLFTQQAVFGSGQ